MRIQKGISGISTLIIFLAIVLVAAVAALVILQTISSLQAQSFSTGTQSKEEVATGIQAEKIVLYARDENFIDYIRIIVKLSPGSQKIPVNTIVLTYSQGNYLSGLDINREIGGGDNNNNPSAISSMMLREENNSAYDLIWLGESTTYNSDFINEGQRAEIWYDCPDVAKDTPIEITLTPTRGMLIRIPFRTPRFYDQNNIAVWP